MTDKFQNKYRIPSVRLQNWDYGADGAYFITICTHNRKHYFGEIINNEMELNEIGEIVKIEWLNTPKIRPDMNLQLNEYIVMPNHFHTIIIIGENKYNSQRNAQRRDAMHCVSTTTNTANASAIPTNKFAPQSKNLASIIRGFKSAVTINARKIHADFAWQTRFYDHIIRNSAEFERIQNYITNNPLNWKKDKFYE